MIDDLSRIRLRVDEWIDGLIREENLQCTLEKFKTLRAFKPLKYGVTVELVKDPEVARVARKHILRLMEERERCGYLYHLNRQRLFKPLDLRFDAEPAVESKRYNAVLEALHQLASEFARPDTTLHDITRMELVYFFVLAINRECTWVTVDYVLQGTKSHGLLVAASQQI